MTKEEIEQFFAHEELRKKVINTVESITEDIIKIRNLRPLEFDEITEINEDIVKAKISYYHCSGCGEDWDYIEFPTSYLYTENWKDKELQKIEEEKRIFEEKERLKKENKQKDKEERDKRLYFKLKEKFENDNS